MAKAQEAAKPTGKGHATPSRKEQEALRKRPLVLDRKADSARIRAERAAQNDREYKAMKTGDERNMPVMHSGAPRRFARDYIDARTTISEFILIASFVLVFVMFFLANYPEIYYALQLGFLVMMGAWVIETFVVLRGLRSKATAKFGADRLPPKYRIYGLMRLWQPRRMRLPKPQVKRGEYPR